MSEATTPPEPNPSTDDSGREATVEEIDLPDAWECVENEPRKGVLFVNKQSRERWQSISLTPYGAAGSETIVANHRKAPYDATRVGADPVERTTIDGWGGVPEWVHSQIEGE
jgi:hypothetical protein